MFCVKKQVVDWNFMFLREIFQFCGLIYEIMFGLGPSRSKNKPGIWSQGLVKCSSRKLNVWISKNWYYIFSILKKILRNHGGGGGFRWFRQCPKENVYFRLMSSLKMSPRCRPLLSKISFLEPTCYWSWVGESDYLYPYSSLFNWLYFLSAYIINTEGDLRRPKIYDNHPMPSIHI